MKCASVLLACALACAAGCARDVHAVYPVAAVGPPPGTLVVQLSEDTENVTVVVNGQLMADRRHTGKVTIEGVPCGRAVVEVTAGGGRQTRVVERREVEVFPGRKTSIPIAGPEMTTAQGILGGLSTVGIWIVYAALLL